jgi:glycosyltransferase involved in cell wall biosynthesis
MSNKMEKPLVSVHMITYNHAPYIANALEGVLQQKTTFSYELIIGEDFSTDGTREIVFEYQKKYPRKISVITSDRNVGAKNNYARVSRSCKGKYIAFCEGDDYWNNRMKLQKQVEYMEAHPECGLIYSSYDVYHVTSKKYIKDFIKYKKREIPKNLTISDVVAGKSFILTCTTLVRKNLFKKVVEADAELHQSDANALGDTQLWAEITSLAKTYFISESMATHNITEESLTRSKDIKKTLQFEISAANVMLKLCEKHNIDKSIKNKYEENYCYSSLQAAFFNRNAVLADEVRRRKATFTWKDRLWYLGTKNVLIYYFLNSAVRIRMLIKDKHVEWL